MRKNQEYNKELGNLTKLTRRSALQLTAGASLLPLTGLTTPGILRAQERDWRHGMSLFGELKYPANYKNFEYVNPDAPKAGHIRMVGNGSYDSFNIFSFKGVPAALVGQTFDTLFSAALDEPSTMYGLIASHASHPDDYSSVTFKLNPKARFHDGEPITPQDVIWSMEAQRSANPRHAFYYKNVKIGEKTGDHEITFNFSSKGNRELPHIVAQLVVLPKHWWEGKDKKGNPRDIKKSTLEVLLGAGAYKVKDFKAGDWVQIERVEDYWAKDLPVNQGQNNFDTIKQIYFRDSSAALEAFKADQYDWRVENNSKSWATQYKFPAVKNNRVIIDKIDQKNGQGMQGFAFNTRRKLFTDPRVRHAFNLAFDFEWSNKNLFFGQYKRTSSFFSNSELASSGLPSTDELKILEPLRGKIPNEVFDTEFKNPVAGNSGNVRKNLRKASILLRQAGWKRGKDHILQNSAGEKLEFKILLVSPAFERIVLPYTKQLKLLGVKTSVRIVDVPQYIRQIEAFDFDCIVNSWGQSLSPGNEQRNYWGSNAAGRNGSRNYIGIKDPAIDKLIERVIFSTNRKDLITATRALDRVLLWNHFVVPMWHISYDRTARWNRFGHPEKLPDFSNGFPAIWWWDEEKAAQTEAAK